MKNLFLVLLLLFAFVACEDDCTQDAYCQLVSNQDYGKVSSVKSGDTVEVCHNGSTISVSTNALQGHLNHGDTEGACQVLSSNDLEFRDGEVVDIPCGYDLPFMHVTENGTQWFYTNPSNR